jgi:hypothetical protein
MKAVAENRYIRAVGNAIQREAHFYTPRPPRGLRMDLRCPNCGSTDLKKASLVYEEGSSRTKARSRLRGLSFGDEGPNLVVGTSVTNGTYQTEVSKQLRPPKKWSYGRLLVAAVLVALASLIFYVHVVMSSSTKSSGMSVVFLAVLGFSVLLIALFLTWRHNQLVYPRQFADWNASWQCSRCGGISSQNVA